MSPHIQEALIGGLIASVPTAIAFLLAIGGFRRMLRDFPLHRHRGKEVIYPKGYEPSEVQVLRVNGGTTE